MRFSVAGRVSLAAVFTEIYPRPCTLRNPWYTGINCSTEVSRRPRERGTGRWPSAARRARPTSGTRLSLGSATTWAGWGDVRIHLRVRSAGAAARVAAAFSNGSRQPGGHGWIWRIPQRFLPLQPKGHAVLLLLLRVSSQSAWYDVVAA
jgi:hypothetical protein